MLQTDIVENVFMENLTASSRISLLFRPHLINTNIDDAHQRIRAAEYAERSELWKHTALQER
jgi:hypothetical protein